MRPGDDVEPIFFSEPLEETLVFGRQLGEAAHGSRRRELGQIAQQLHREIFGEQHELQP